MAPTRFLHVSLINEAYGLYEAPGKTPDVFLMLCGFGNRTIISEALREHLFLYNMVQPRLDCWLAVRISLQRPALWSLGSSRLPVRPLLSDIRGGAIVGLLLLAGLLAGRFILQRPVCLHVYPLYQLA